MKTVLNVPFAQKEEARRLGAKWDQARRTWFVENLEDLVPFLKWMPATPTVPPQAPRRFAGKRDDEYRQAAARGPAIEYSVGQRLVIVWSQKWRALDIAEVTELRRDGGVRLSNGWVADADGVLAGAKLHCGGRIAGEAPK